MTSETPKSASQPGSHTSGISQADDAEVTESGVFCEFLSTDNSSLAPKHVTAVGGREHGGLKNSAFCESESLR
jgi:hypothetical protein